MGDVERETIGSVELQLDLLKMLKNGSKNDVTIVCQDGELLANRHFCGKVGILCNNA